MPTAARIAGGSRALLGRHPLAAIVVVGLLLRTSPWWAPHNLLGVMEYDDGVYYAAAKLLLHGEVPYRDFTIVHPPVLTVALLPFALVGEWLGDPIGMATARAGMLLVAAANIVLIHRLALLLPGPETRRRALLAAGVYALMPNAVIAEHTVLLEPIVNTCCLAGVYLLVRRPGHRTALACGALVVAGIGVKLFAGAYVLAVLVWLLAGRRRSLVPAFAAGLGLGSLVLLGPFIALAPSQAWHDVVVTQLSRPTNTGVDHGLERALSMLGLGWLPVVVGAVVLAALAACLVRALRTELPALALWTALLVPSGIAILWAPTYFLHYGAFLGPAVAILCSRLVGDADRRWRALSTGSAAAVLLAFCIGSGSDVLHQRARPDLAAVQDLVPDGSCVWFDAVSVALAADVYRLPSPECPSWVDGRGVALTESRGWPKGVDFYPAGFVADEAWQEATVAQMRHADYLLLRHAPASFPEWTPETRAYVLGHFSRQWSQGRDARVVELWKREASG